jgi:hypothetical protein
MFCQALTDKVALEGFALSAFRTEVAVAVARARAGNSQISDRNLKQPWQLSWYVPSRSRKVIVMVTIVAYGSAG